MKSISLSRLGRHARVDFGSCRSLVPLLSLASLIVLCCPTQARAENSVTIKKGTLQRADKFYTAPLQIQITDDRPRVKDLRVGDPAPENFVIPIGPMPQAQGAGNSSVRMVPNNLPAAGFGPSNIPARGFAPAQALQLAKSGGLSPVDKAPRPVGLTGPKTASRQLVSAKPFTSTPTAAIYPDVDRSSLMGNSGLNTTSSKSVLARLRAPGN